MEYEYTFLRKVFMEEVTAGTSLEVEWEMGEKKVVSNLRSWIGVAVAVLRVVRRGWMQERKRREW